MVEDRMEHVSQNCVNKVQLDLEGVKITPCLLAFLRADCDGVLVAPSRRRYPRIAFRANLESTKVR